MWSDINKRQDEQWKEDTGGIIRCHHCDWSGQAETIAEALTKKNQHYAAAHLDTQGEPDVER